jgi:WD40 repeat protein
MVWDTATGERLHTLRDKLDTMLAIQYLVIDPIESTSDEITLLSSSSDPKIRRWRISLSSADQILEDADNKTGTPAGRDAIHEHETSVYRLFFDSDDGDLWTASADGNAKCLSRARQWAAEETYEHEDYVRAVVVTPDWIITAGRSEDIKVWDRNTGKLFHVYDGHYEEITGLVIMNDGKQVISVSIDGTVRTWSLTKGDLEKARREKEEKEKGIIKETQPVAKTSLMTAEEEAELAELMDDSD